MVRFNYGYSHWQSDFYTVDLENGDCISIVFTDVFDSITSDNYMVFVSSGFRESVEALSKEGGAYKERIVRALRQIYPNKSNISAALMHYPDGPRWSLIENNSSVFEISAANLYGKNLDKKISEHDSRTYRQYFESHEFGNALKFIVQKFGSERAKRALEIASEKINLDLSPAETSEATVEQTSPQQLGGWGLAIGLLGVATALTARSAKAKSKAHDKKAEIQQQLAHRN